MLTTLQQQTPFVAFVGAGASAIPPSFLPSWNGFNNLLLECLCERLAAFSDNRQPTDDMLARFQERRDETQFFAPDFQAQLMEEEIGGDYFKVWQSLETDQYSPVHTGLTQLATQNQLAAIITTNFDCLLEKALEEKGQSFKVYYDPAGFDELLADLAQPESTTLPIIKIHGSLEDASSLIDTLKQRMVGRPPAMLEALQLLLRRHPWLFLGFSGADFSYNPHYLGILDAAAEAAGFVFLAREGREVQAGVKRLVEAFGEDKTEIVFGDLNHWLADTFSLSPAKKTAEQKDAAAIKELVTSNIQKWTQNLGHMAVVNMVCSMLKSSGLDGDAFWVQRKTWKSYRAPDDTKGKSYWRYNFNYGLSLLEAGQLVNPIVLADDKHNLMEWKQYADRTAQQYLYRSFSQGNMLVAGAQLARCYALRGDLNDALSIGRSIIQHLDETSLDYCDIIIAFCTIYDITQSFKPPIEQLSQCLEISKKLGDEPRRAIILSQLGRFLSYAGDYDQAKEHIERADTIARRLDLQSVLLANKAVHGLWLSESNTSHEEAVQVLLETRQTLKAKDDVPLFTRYDLAQQQDAPEEVMGINPITCRVLLDLNQAALNAGMSDLTNATFDELDVLATSTYLGYCPHYYLRYARCILLNRENNDVSMAADLIQRAAQMGNDTGNTWATQMAQLLSQHL